MSDPITAYLDEVRALHEGATEGPWELDMDGDIQGRRPGLSADPEVDPIVGTLEREEDTKFAAHSRTDVPRMEAALRAVLSVVAIPDPHGPGEDCPDCEQSRSIRQAVASALGVEVA